MTSLDEIGERVAACRRCDRLVEWRERCAREPRAAFVGEDYWAKGVPGFGDLNAKLVIVGLAPAAHGANRTGRMFTGDRSGDFLFAALHRLGAANQPQSIAANDGLALTNVWVTSPVRCAPPENKPTAAERNNCVPFLNEELAVLQPRVILCLGGFAWRYMVKHLGLPAPRPKFAHAANVTITTPPWQTAEARPTAGALRLFGSYHVSQYNVFTGRLTEPMFDEVLGAALSASGS